MIFVKGTPQQRMKSERGFDTDKLIDRLAADLRARSDPSFPHSYYVPQARRQFASEMERQTAAGEGLMGRMKVSQPHSSVFHAWAFPE